MYRISWLISLIDKLIDIRDKFGMIPCCTLQAVDVRWGEFSIVEAELNCLQDLLNNSRPWSYALDMAGSEVMLATNKELVDSLDRKAKEIYTASFPLPKNNENRIKYKFKPGLSKKEPQDPVPYNLTIYKGAKSWKLPRTFVSFLLTHPVAIEFLEWSR